MTWDLTLLAVHIVAALGFTSLYCSAPDWLQKLVLGLLISSSLILVYVYAVEAFSDGAFWLVKLIALKVEHLAVLLYLFRLIFRERMQCRNSLPHYRRSLP